MTEEEKEAINKLKRSANYFIMPIHETNIILNYIERLQKENTELKSKKQLEIDTSEEVLKWKGKYHLLSRENQELKDRIREFIKKELPDDEIMECCSICDVNGVTIREELEKILKDKE